MRKFARPLERFAVAAALLALAPFAAAAEPEPQPGPPNIVFILADDLGYRDLSCYGAPQIKTPNIDRIAADGTKFTEFYAAAPVCTPTRAALLTGCYPKRVGLHIGVLNPGTPKGLNPEEITVAELLKAKGYTTACIGKWHLGERPETLPTSQGFDSYFGMAGPNHGASDLYRDTEIIEKKGAIQLDQLTRRYTAEAVAFIERHQADPFFLYVAHGAPHVPLYASADFKGKSAAGLYGDMVEELDGSVGRVMAALKTAGIDGRTLVVFTSDNGPGDTAAVPLHGGKGSTWEGGLRVPCVARWPGVVPPGTRCQEMAVIYDWFPTLAGLAGAPLPARTIDGRDIWPLVIGRAGAKSPHDNFVYYSREGLASAIRAGRWKLHVVAPVERWAGKLPPEALLDTVPTDPLPWLYDLEADIGETKNVAADHPEIAARLRAALEEIDTTLATEARPVFSAENK